MTFFRNQAQLSFRTVQIHSNVVCGEIIEGLHLTYRTLNTSYRRGNEVTFLATIENTGQTPRNGITLNDDLGGYPFSTRILRPLAYVPESLLYFQNGFLQSTPMVSVFEGLSVSGLTIPAHGSASVLYSVRTTEFAPPRQDGRIVSTATVSGCSRGGGLEHLEGTVSVSAASAPELTISKSVLPSTVEETGLLTYTFVLLNHGNLPSGSSDLVTIEDTFSPILHGLCVMLNGKPWTAGQQYTYDEVTGLFRTGKGQLQVPAAAYTQNAVSGLWRTDPGSLVLTVSGHL